MVNLSSTIVCDDDAIAVLLESLAASINTNLNGLLQNGRFYSCVILCDLNIWNSSRYSLSERSSSIVDRNARIVGAISRYEGVEFRLNNGVLLHVFPDVGWHSSNAAIISKSLRA